jgi:hypothetical protein
MSGILSVERTRAENMRTDCNVIVLTSGISGSSLLTNVLSLACGLWKAERSIKKADYDTHEDPALVAINERLLELGCYKGKYHRDFDEEGFGRISRIEDEAIAIECKELVRGYKAHSPWIWKDPRLWATIGYWHRFIGSENIKYIILDRDPMQRWISLNLRRQIQSYPSVRKYGDHVKSQIRSFLRENELSFFELSYDGLLQSPKDTLLALSRFTGCEVELAHLEVVCDKHLLKKRRGINDFIVALSIYLWNFREHAK